jgi:RNA polymerase sigma factor (sigma-70 family)
MLMAIGPMSGVIDRLRGTALLTDCGNLTDGQLLESFIARRDEAAFAGLVRRHGPMVLGVCRRILGNSHDADDAFQAAFLVLVRKAGSVEPRELVGNWLYGVACRTAWKAKSAAAKRRLHERQVQPMPATQPRTEADWSDLQPVLDQELERLGANDRTAVVLCDLEGKSQREAARCLGWPEGTLTTRLTRARRLLAQRLTRRGVALSSGALALTLAQHAASAAVPAPLALSTIQAATLLAAGQAAAAASAPVAALTEGVLHAMFMTKVKTTLAIVLTVAVLGGGAGLSTRWGFGDNVVAGERTKAVARNVEPEPFDPAILESLDAEQAAREREQEAARGRDDAQGRPNIMGKIGLVADDSKEITIEIPPQARGEAAGKDVVKLTDKTSLVFSGVGPGGAKLQMGQYAQVWLAGGSKDVAATVHVRAAFGSGRNDRNAADVTGRVTSVAADTITIQTPPRARGDDGASVTVKHTKKTNMVYSFVAKGGTKPNEGYQAQVWLERGTKDTAARIDFTGTEGPSRETGIRAAVARFDQGGKVVGVGQDGKEITIEVPPQVRGGEAGKATIKLDDKTTVAYLTIGPDGDRPAEGYTARVWLADGSKDTAKSVIFQAPPPKDPRTVWHGQVVSVGVDGKSFTLEMRPEERGGEPRKVNVVITERTHVTFNGVGPNGAKLTEGYVAEVWLQESSSDTAENIVLGPADRRGR